jgi:two-component system cell cycle response regulator
MSVVIEARKQLVSVFGFSESERRALKSMFNLAGVRAAGYSLVNPEERITPDIALVDADDPQAMDAWQRDRQSHTNRTPAVMVTKTADSSAEEHRCISRPLTMKKVLNALEGLNSQVKVQGPAEQTEASATRAPAQPDRYSALIVDDSLSVRRFMESKLGTLGVAVDIEFAATGEQALALSEDRHYDIVFLDVMLPGIDGYRVCKALKSSRAAGQSRVVMLTSKKSPFDRVKGSMAGCDAYLTKPPDAQRLDSIIQKYLLKD